MGNLPYRILGRCQAHGEGINHPWGFLSLTLGPIRIDLSVDNMDGAIEKPQNLRSVDDISPTHRALHGVLSLAVGLSHCGVVYRHYSVCVEAHDWSPGGCSRIYAS